MIFYLRTATEIYLKRAVVGGGVDRVFEINRNFRNEGAGLPPLPELPRGPSLDEAYSGTTTAWPS